jgi:hypothetical protein
MLDRMDNEQLDCPQNTTLQSELQQKNFMDKTSGAITTLSLLFRKTKILVKFSDN